MHWILPIYWMAGSISRDKVKNKSNNESFYYAIDSLLSEAIRNSNSFKFSISMATAWSLSSVNRTWTIYSYCQDRSFSFDRFSNVTYYSFIQIGCHRSMLIVDSYYFVDKSFDIQLPFSSSFYAFKLYNRSVSVNWFRIEWQKPATIFALT